MAKIKPITTTQSVAKPFKRSSAQPLDSTEVFYSLEDLKAYATKGLGGTAYVGQICVVVDQANNKSTGYVIINEAGDLDEIQIKLIPGVDYLTPEQASETFVSNEDLEEKTTVILPGAITKAMETDPTMKEVAKETVSAVLPGALAEALRSQTNPDSGLAVDEDGNISVQLNEEHLKIVDNRIGLNISLIQAIESV